MDKEYYVYGAYGLHGELLYIGYGKGDRYKHCNNGMSSNKGLNLIMVKVIVFVWKSYMNIYRKKKQMELRRI